MPSRDALQAANHYQADRDERGENCGVNERGYRLEAVSRPGLSAGDDNYVASDDDGPSHSDDEFHATVSSSNEFSALLSAIADEILEVFSTNPFTIDLKASAPILALVGGMLGCLFLGMIFFLRWDKMERHQAMYLIDEKLLVLKSEIADDLRHGGNGVDGDVMLRRKINLKKRSKVGFTEWMNESFATDKTQLERSSSSMSSMKSMKMSLSSKKSVTYLYDPDEDNLQHAVLVAQFTNNAVPNQYSVGKEQYQMKEGELVIKPSFTSIFRTLRQTHFLTAMFYGESLRYSRTNRFLRMFRKMLMGIFCDTVIYGAFFPADTTCRVYVTKKSCQQQQSRVIAGSTLCSWNGDKHTCSINTPPNEITFVLLVAFIIAIFLVPLDFIMDFIQEEYASKRPRLEGWGMSTDSWLGSVFHKRVTDVSPIVHAAAYVSKRDLFAKEPSMRSIAPTDLHKVDTEMGLTEADVIAKKIFQSTLTPKEEVKRIMALVHEAPFFNIVKSGGVLSARDGIVVKAITSKLMLYYDGTPRPLTFRQNLFFKNRDHLLAHRLTVAKTKATAVCKEIADMEVRSDSFKDIALIRKFVLENVNIFYRFSLRRCFNEIDGTPPEFIDARYWLLSWIVVIGLLSFFLVWILLWGITNGATTLKSWGTVYGIEVLQAILIYECVKMGLMYVFAVMSAKPGLQVIKRVINDRALSYIQNTEFKEELSAVQHFSPACRAAHMSRLSDLPSAAILRRMTDSDIEKCKEHKNFRISAVIFYILIFAAAIAAVNESCVDQFLDTAVSSLWLGFVLLNHRLAGISPAILVVIYGSIGGYFIYKSAVLVPSIKQARLLRAEINHRKCASRTIHSDVRQVKKPILFLMQFAKRLYMKVNRYAVALIVSLSFEGRNGRRRKRRLDALAWLDINKEPRHQGHIASRFEESYTGYLTENNSLNGISLAASLDDEECKVDGESKVELMTLAMAHSKKHHKNIFEEYPSKNTIPEAILRMRERQPSANQLQNAILVEPTGYTAFLKSYMSKSEGDVLAANERFPPGTEIELPYTSTTTPIILKTYGIFAKKYKSNIATTNSPYIALRRMLLRHLIGASSYDSGGELNSYDHFKVSETFILMSELSLLLDWVWLNYHPDNGPLDTDRKEEVNELFMEWRQKVVIECHISGKTARSNGRSNVEGVYFTEFTVWFLSLCHVICPRLRLEDAVEFNDDYLYCNVITRASNEGTLSVVSSRRSSLATMQSSLASMPSSALPSRPSSRRNSRQFSSPNVPKLYTYPESDDGFE